MEQGICYIFGAGDATACDIQLTPNDYVIAADGGFDYATHLGLIPNIAIGDFDSISTSALPENRIVHPPEKDETDMMLALRHGLDKGYHTIHIYGGLGGRLDHTLANIQNLAWLAGEGGQGFLFSDLYTISVIKDSSITLPTSKEGYFSVFSLTDQSQGISITGGKYPLSNASLSNHFPLGVSNEFAGNQVKICVKKGTLIILWYPSY